MKSLNKENPDSWKEDIWLSKSGYIDWYLHKAPEIFESNRLQAKEKVEALFDRTDNLKNISAQVLKDSPEILSVLRIAASPPLSRDQLIGFTETNRQLVSNMENSRHPVIPSRMDFQIVNEELQRIVQTLIQLLDSDLFIWIREKREPAELEIERAKSELTGRLSTILSNARMRNIQEKRELESLEQYLKQKGYRKNSRGIAYNEMEPGTFSYHINIPVINANGSRINTPVDAAIMPMDAAKGELPVLIEAKSASDYANVNKRRKEEAAKMSQLKAFLGEDIWYILLLSGFFDQKYLNYEAREGIDWIWLHRIEDLEKLNI